RQSTSAEQVGASRRTIRGDRAERPGRIERHVEAVTQQIDRSALDRVMPVHRTLPHAYELSDVGLTRRHQVTRREGETMAFGAHAPARGDPAPGATTDRDTAVPAPRDDRRRPRAHARPRRYRRATFQDGYPGSARASARRTPGLDSHSRTRELTERRPSFAHPRGC